jgi:hypothetical protein
VVFEHVIDALVHGSRYERIATAGCSDRTIRRRLGSGRQPGWRRRSTRSRWAPMTGSSVWSWRTCQPTSVSPRHPVVGTRPAHPRWTGAHRASSAPRPPRPTAPARRGPRGGLADLRGLPRARARRTASAPLYRPPSTWTACRPAPGRVGDAWAGT